MNYKQDSMLYNRDIIKEKLLFSHCDLNILYFDLSVKNHDATDDQVTI